MPALDTSLEKEMLFHGIFYGPAKLKKTWLAATAAEAGFNVILLDMEKGAGILKNLSAPARKRIYRIDAQNTKTRAVAAEFMVNFCKFPNLYWDEVVRKRVMHPTEDSIQLNWNRFDKNTVVIVDSYSALVWSLAVRYSIENKIDLSDALKPEWDGYGFCGRLATWVLEQLSLLPCHLIIIGHQQVYEKSKTVNKQRVVEWSRTQMTSVSGPHAMQIAKMFDEVLYFSMQGSSFYVTVQPERDRDGGGRYIPPARYKWEELQFVDICKHTGIQLPPADLMPVTELVKCVKPVKSTASKSLLGGTSKSPKTVTAKTGAAAPSSILKKPN